MKLMPSHTLKRTVTTPMLTLYGIGNIVGAGVYVLIGKIADPAGYLSLLAFAIAALVAFCSALSYAELASRFPVSAGVSVYLYEAFKKRSLSTTVGFMLIGAGVVSSATLVKGFSGYFTAIVPINANLAMIGIMLILTGVALRGIKESVGIAALFTCIEVGGLLFLIGSIMIAQPAAIGDFTNHFTHSLGAMNGASLAGLLSAAFIAFYAFVGFEDMINIAEEVKKPKRAFPIAIMASMIVVTFLYGSVAVGTLAVMSPDALSQSSAPLADAYQTATGNSAMLIIIIGIIATLNGVLVNIVMGSRILYGLARRGWTIHWFAKLSQQYVPARGLLIVSCVALLCAILIPLENLAQITSLLLLLIFCSVNISLIVIRHQHPIKANQLRVAPRYLPWIGAITSLGLLVVQLISFFVSKV
jgi:basic amino acid/polyamine antiporter, APA family